MMTDPIADMLTRIRNGMTAGLKAVDMPASKVKEEVARVLLQEGFIDAWKTVESTPQNLLRVYLKVLEDGTQVMRGIKRISKPGRRMYCGVAELKPVLAGTGVAVVSTSKGMMSDRQCREARIGGEVLCEVW